MDNTIVKFYKYGSTGAAGENGQRGSQTLINTRAPLPEDGLFPDVWINALTGETWSKQLNGNWLQGASLQIGTGGTVLLSTAIYDGQNRPINDGNGRTITYV